MVMVTGTQRILEQTSMRKNNLTIPPLFPATERMTAEIMLLWTTTANKTQMTQRRPNTWPWLD